MTVLIEKNMKQKSIAAITVGCKLNYSETSAILDRFVSEGWTLSTVEKGADLFIIHTCAVTAQAEQKSRQQIRKIIRNNSGSRVAVVGCYAQLDPDRLAAIEGVSVVLGTSDKFSSSSYTDLYCPPGHEVPFVKVSPVDSPGSAQPGHSLLSQPDKGRTRAFLKIQDGCSHGCAYCTIPLARGRSRAVSTEIVLETARKLVTAGYREIVLTGVNIAAYRDGSTGFADLLQKIEHLGVGRIRIGSVEPDLLDDRIIDIVAASEVIMPHFHLPLQSGSDSVLRAMGRHYDTETYRARFIRAVTKISGCAIGADVMAGYPGESEEDFQEMYRFLEALPAAYLHVFSCSVRPGTLLARQVADRSRKVVPGKTAASRSALLAQLGREKERAFASSFTGKKMGVLFEESVPAADDEKRRICSGYTRNYLRVRVEVDRVDAGLLKGCERDVLVIGPGCETGEDLYLQGRLLF